MSRDEQREPDGQARPGFDPEAEQEVDFSRYWRLLVARWWLVVIGLVLGAVAGYAVSLGGSQVYKASADVYLGQPYSASGNISLQTLQTNPATLRAITRSQAVVLQASSACGLTPGAIRSGLAVDAVPGSLTKNNQNPVIEITVQGKKGKKAACAANKLARVVVDKVSAFANQKIANFSQQISLDERQQTLINQALQRGGLSASDQLLLQLRLATVQSDRLSTSQLLLQARQVEQPQILTTAAFQRVTARSRRNVVVVAALIGLVLGILAALAWDRVVPRFSQRA